MTDAVLEAFIEADAIHWLDSTTAPLEDAPKPMPGVPVFFLTRDYERELKEALDADEISRAKHILHDLKERFDEAPDGTAEKNQIKTILISLYEQFRMRLERDDDPDRTDVELTRLMRSWGIQPIESTTDTADEEAATAPPVSSHRHRRHHREEPASKPSGETAVEPMAAVPDPRAERAREERIAHASELLDGVERDLAAGNVRAAAVGYRATRREVLGIDGGVPDDIAKRLLAVFERVRDTLREARATGHDLHIPVPPAPTIRSAPEPPALPAIPDAPAVKPVLATPPAPTAVPASLPALPTVDTTDVAAFDRAIIWSLETRKHDLDMAVDRHDIALAMRIYDGMRTAALHLRDPARQSDVARKLKLLHELLARLRHSSHDDRDLSGQVP